jgi:hypothetical protein
LELLDVVGLNYWAILVDDGWVLRMWLIGSVAGNYFTRLRDGEIMLNWNGRFFSYNTVGIG